MECKTVRKKGKRDCLFVSSQFWWLFQEKLHSTHKLYMVIRYIHNLHFQRMCQLIQLPSYPHCTVHTYIYLIFFFRNFSISSKNCESRISFDSPILDSAFIHTYKNQFRTQIFHLHIFISFSQWISQFTLNSSLIFSGSSFFLPKK